MDYGKEVFTQHHQSQRQTSGYIFVLVLGIQRDWPRSYEEWCWWLGQKWWWCMDGNKATLGNIGNIATLGNIGNRATLGNEDQSFSLSRRCVHQPPHLVVKYIQRNMSNTAREMLQEKYSWIQLRESEKYREGNAVYLYFHHPLLVCIGSATLLRVHERYTHACVWCMCNVWCTYNDFQLFNVMSRKLQICKVAVGWREQYTLYMMQQSANNLQ